MNLADVPADDNGHIEDNVVQASVNAAADMLGLRDFAAAPDLAKLCYKIVDNTIKCYHCYDFWDEGDAKSFTKHGVTVDVYICYSWPFPLPLPE